jgi:diguanylate cyclase (GGDEF)-like protein/PAS domain S-box-containing protein
MSSDIVETERSRAAAALGLSRLMEPGSLLEATPECLVVAHTDGRIIFANRHVETLTGFSREELWERSIDRLLATDPRDQTAGTSVETLCRDREGGAIPVEVNVGVIEGVERFLVVTLRDMTELRAGREARFAAEAKYRTLVEQIPAVVYLDPVDENQGSIYVSPQVTELLGIEPAEWLEDPYCWRRHVHAEDIDRVWQEYEDSYRTHVPLNHEYRMLHEDGSIRWVMEQAFSVKDENGEPWLIQGVIFDITQRKFAEEEIAFLAYHDKLTGLPNRALFEEMLESALARARRFDLGVGVLFLDLDNFKLVNDSLGHHAGDQLLIQLADRLRVCTRETDLVARLSGDEFLLLLADLDRGAGAMGGGPDSGLLIAESVAARVREALEQSFDLGGSEFFVSASIGISLYPQDASDAETLLRNADAAMYRSKEFERGGFVVYAASDDDPAHRLSFSTRLRQAVADRNWVLHYQPIIDLGDGSVHSVEALVRWLQPNGGLVAPGEFIPLAEEMGLIQAIGDWVLEELARQHAEWRAQGVQVAIGYNLSPRQMWTAHLAEKLLAKLAMYDVEPQDVTIEITESTAMADPDRTQRLLTELHAWGFTLAIDDFGTGYSSLARLKHMPVDVLKIDQAFVRHVEYDRDLAGMVRAMVQLAQSLGMVPLAEGIETYGEYEFLRANGCRLAQGFHFAYPVPAADIPALVRSKGGLSQPPPLLS